MECALTFLHCNHMPHCDAIVDKYFDGYYTLQFMEQGAVSLSYDQCEYSLEGEWFWPAFPGPHIRFSVAPKRKTWNHRYVAFRGSQANRWVAEGLFPKGPQLAPRGKAHATTFDELLLFAHRSDALGTRRAMNLLENILLELAEARSTPTQREEWLENVFGALDADSHFAPDYEKLAQKNGMALSTLRRRFRGATGIPIHEYSLQRRIARAREWLGETDWPIKAIAEKLGYSDVYFFARQFKDQTGVPPAAYRKSRQ